MNERKFTIKFHKWAKHFIKESSVFEIKISKTKSMSFQAVKEHQIIALDLSQNKKLVYKIPDEGFSQKPFDMILLSNIKSYIVIFWYLKRGAKEFTIININDWLKEIESSDRKSITYIRACQIGNLYLL